jgi:O-antigen/teichoic acid export membrane protein
MDRVAIMYALGLVANIVLNYLWIPGLGAEGAARALAVCESLLAAGMLYLLHAHAAALPRLRTWVATAGVGVLLLALSFAPDPTGGVLAALVFGTLAISWFVLTGALPAHERAALRAAFRFRP